jgi:hypothetical protein
VASVAGREERLDILVGPELASAHKLFTPRLEHGFCGIQFPRTREALTFRFDPNALPFVGLWLCQGGWPTEQDGHFVLALEPCTARADALAEAASRGEHRVLPPHVRHEWSIELSATVGDDSCE